MAMRTRTAALMVVASLFAAAAFGAESDLISIVAGVNGRNPAQAWHQLASFLAQHAKWAAAAEAEEHVGREEASRLLLARYRLNADDLRGAQAALDLLPADLRAAAWLRAELLLARGDKDGAARKRLIAQQGLGNFEGGDLYCSQDLVPHQIDEYLAARIAFARDEIEEALSHARAAAEPIAFPDAVVLAANALDRLGQQDEALVMLTALGQQPPTPGANCPGVLLDRVLFNQANIVASQDNIDRAADLYRQAIRIADDRERAFAQDVAGAGAPTGSQIAHLLEGAVLRSNTAAPDARNNLGHLLLQQALRGTDDSARLTLVVEAKSLFREALAARGYSTRDYAYAGLAKAEAAGGQGSSAVEQIARALHLNPGNTDAIDIAAMLMRDKSPEVAALAAIQFVTATDATMPRDWVDSRYKEVIHLAEVNARSSNAEPVVALRALLNLRKGDLTSAQVAVTQFPSAPWSRLLDAELTARRDWTSSRPATTLNSLLETLRTQPSKRAWEVSMIRQVASTTQGLSENGVYPRSHQTCGELLALVSPSGRDDRSFPWQSAELDRVKFKLGSFELDENARAALDEFAGRLKSLNEQFYIEIQGHTDDTGSHKLNDELAQHRADEVRSYLARSAQLPLSRMSTISYGDKIPVAPNKTTKGRAENRRVVIVELE